MAAKTEGKTIKGKGEAVNKEMRAKIGMVDVQEAIQETEALLSGSEAVLGVLAITTLGLNVNVLIIGQAQHADIVATYTNLHFVLDTIRTN